MQLINIILTMLATSVSRAVAAEPRGSFIVMHPASVDPFAGVVSIAEANPSTILRVQKFFFTSVDLTKAEADKVSAKLRPAKGILAPNNLISVDDMVTADINNINVNLLNVDKATPIYSEILTTTPRCPTPLNKVDFVVLDTVIYRNIPEFDGVNITFGPNYVNNTQPCHPHASQMLSLVVGKNYGVIPNGDRGVYNIGVFNCDGFGLPKNIILGIHDAIEFAGSNAQKGRATVVLFSGVRGMNAAVDAATSVLELDGISSFIGVGDSGINACKSNIRPLTVQSFTTGSTTYPGYIPAPFTNYGNQCLDLFIPGVNLNTVNVSNINTGQLVSGTTYSSAVTGALAAMEKGMDPGATPDQVASRIKSQPRTTIVNPPAGSFFQQPMTVMLQNNACPYNRIFNKITTNKLDSNKYNTWYNGTTQNVFCVVFKVNAKRGAILIGLKDDITDPNIVTVMIGKYNHHNAGYTNSIEQGDNVLVSKTTATNIVKNGKNTIIKIISNNETISVLYNSIEKNNPAPLLFAELKKPIRQIAFASHGTADFETAIRCTV